MVPGDVTVAVLMIVPKVGNLARVPEMVYVSVPPGARVTVSLMSPVPLGVQELRGVALHDQVAPSSVGGSVSLTMAPGTVIKPRAWRIVTW